MKQRSAWRKDADPKAAIRFEICLCSMAAMEQIQEVHAATVSGSNRYRAAAQTDQSEDRIGPCAAAQVRGVSEFPCVRLIEPSPIS